MCKEVGVVVWLLVGFPVACTTWSIDLLGIRSSHYIQGRVQLEVFWNTRGVT